MGPLLLCASGPSLAKPYTSVQFSVPKSPAFLISHAVSTMNYSRNQAILLQNLSFIRNIGEILRRDHVFGCILCWVFIWITPHSCIRHDYLPTLGPAPQTFRSSFGRKIRPNPECDRPVIGSGRTSLIRSILYLRNIHVLLSHRAALLATTLSCVYRDRLGVHYFPSLAALRGVQIVPRVHVPCVTRCFFFQRKG